MNKLAVYVFVVLIAAGVFGWQKFEISTLESQLADSLGRVKTLRENRDELAGNLESAESEKAALRQQLNLLQDVMAERDTQLSALSAQSAELSEQLTGLRKTDEETKMWSDAHVPDAVIRLLRSSRTAGDHPDGVSKDSGAGKSAGTD